MNGETEARPRGGGSPSGGGGSSRPVQIEVRAFTNPAGLVDFTHEWKLEGDSGPMKTGKIHLPRAKTSYRLKFRLTDNTNPKKKLSFKCPAEDAMYVAPGNSCPTEPGDGGGQIDFTGPCTSSQLIVEDMNYGDECDLSYTLRFDGDPGHQASDPGKARPPYEYDPEIRNGGGNNQ